MTSVYAAAKGGLLWLSRYWANALGARGIRVNALMPGPIDTDFRSFMATKVRTAFEQEVLLNLALPHIVPADQAATVALLLLSDDAFFVTGAQYAVDGGQVMQ